MSRKLWKTRKRPRMGVSATKQTGVLGTLYSTKRRTVHVFDLPEEPPTVSVYVVVCIGLTEIPLRRDRTHTGRSAELAFCEPHARLADSPRSITSGFAEMMHEGGPRDRRLHCDARVAAAVPSLTGDGKRECPRTRDIRNGARACDRHFPKTRECRAGGVERRPPQRTSRPKRRAWAAPIPKDEGCGYVGLCGTAAMAAAREPVGRGLSVGACCRCRGKAFTYHG